MSTALRTDADGRYLIDALKVRFTDEQLRAASAPLEPVLVVAGAGSGKTAVMAARVVHLVAHFGIEPAKILGLTFTSKAAAELAGRVRLTLRAFTGGTLDAFAVDDLPTVSTYHSYAASVVKDHALRIGREPQSRLLTEAARWQLAARVVSQARGPFKYLRWQPPAVTQKLLALDAELAEHLVSPEQLRGFDLGFAADVEALDKPPAKLLDCASAARARGELLELVRAYRELKEVHEAIDFGDQVALAALIADQAPEVGVLERQRFEAVLLDEYQDTGVAQRRLLQSLFGEGHAVTAVGDPNQGIYGWRGASVGNLARFPEHFARVDGRPAAVLELMTSFRCGGRILAAANAVAAKLEDSPAAGRRPPVRVRPLSAPVDREDAGEVRVALLNDVEQEAAWVADGIATAVDVTGVPPGECAVLCRRRTDFALLHRALVARGLPVEVVGLGGLLEMPEVADVVATLRVLIDPVANGSLVRLLTGVRWRLGARDLAALGRRARWLVRPPAQESEGDRPADAALREAAERVDPAEVVSLPDALDDPGTA
ncbi:MAG: ATP-dependent helicase UvrD/PcrA, partial [Frankiales bacterium]|nr:ATP-dependent helicase UvrD/PcrA [Frankiales bacterium]